MNETDREPNSRPVHAPADPAFLSQPHDVTDPDPWLAVYLDRSVPIDEAVNRAWLADSSTRCRQFALPLVRPLARLTIILVQLVKIVIPDAFTSSSLAPMRP